MRKTSTIIIVGLFVIMAFNNIFSLNIESFTALQKNPEQKEVNKKLKSKKRYPEIEATELTLSNGMKVILKSAEEDNDDIVIKLTANGGFAQYPPDHRASAELCDHVAWESGFGELTADQLEAIMYKHEIEFHTKIDAYSRSIEGSADLKRIPLVFKFINYFFTQCNFTKEGFDSVLEAQFNAVKNKNKNDFLNIEEAYLSLNTEQHWAFKPLAIQDLQRMNLSASNQYFKKAFGNPADFTCTIVGHFDVAEMEAWVAIYLGEIQKVADQQPEFEQKLPLFAVNNAKQAIHYPGRKDCQARITFSLKESFDVSKMRLLRYVSELLEERLKSRLKSMNKNIHYLDVYSIFPCYPYLGNAWLTIEFHSAPGDVDAISESLLAALIALQDTDFKIEEVDAVQRMLRRSDLRCQGDSYFWISKLTSYGHWGWNLDAIIQEVKEDSVPTPKEIKEFLDKILASGAYTIFTVKP